MANHERRVPITPSQLREIRQVAQHTAMEAEAAKRADGARDHWRGRANRLARIVLALTHPVQQVPQ